MPATVCHHDVLEYGGGHEHGPGQPVGPTEIQQEEKAAHQLAESIRPADGKATLMYVSDGGAIWRISELIEETRHYRGQSFNHRYYLQRLPNPEAVLILAESGRRGRPNATVAPDGTFIMGRPGGVAWYRLGQPATETPRDRWISLQCGIYPDGVLVQKSARKPAPLRFIPFKDQKLDFQNEVEVAPAGVKSFRFGEPVRHGSVFSWATRDAFNFYDLSTAKRWNTPVPFDLGVTHRATVFDGETVIAVSSLPFDAKTGAVVAQGQFNDGVSVSQHFGGPKGNGYLAVRNRIAYYIEDDWLSAIDLMSAPPRSVQLVKVALQPIGEGANGLHVWTGESWTFVPWLETVPPDEQARAAEGSDQEE